MRDDPATAHGFPSWWNSCHHVKPIASPNLAHQREVCLTTKHAFCPAIEAGQKKSLPKELRRREAGRTRKLIGRWIPVVVSLTFLIIGGLIFSGYWVPLWAEKISIPAWISRVIPQKTITNTPTVERETDTPTVVIETSTATPEKRIVSETPSPSREDLAATQTKLVLGRDCAYPLDSPFGAEHRQFLLHRVVEGENMTILTERYKTTQIAIDAVNYFFPSSLWAEHVIIIPLNRTNAADLPSFKPVLLDEEDISLEELAQNLLVSSAELIEFNQIDLSCRSFQGWILVPAEKLIP
ncbi:MAG: hypothetical protein WBB69_06595 [Anaerolineales bacterium]